MFRAASVFYHLASQHGNRKKQLPFHARERASGAYGTASYFTATVAFDFVPMRVLPTTLFAVTTYWMIGLRPGLGRAAAFLLLLVLTNLTGAAMNMAIGASSHAPMRQAHCCRTSSVSCLLVLLLCWQS